MQALAVSSSVGSGGGGVLAAAGGQTAAGGTGDWIIKADKAEVMGPLCRHSSVVCLCFFPCLLVCSLLPESSFLLTVSTS